MSNYNKEALSTILLNFLESIYQFEQIEYKQFGVNWQEIYFLQVLKKSDELTLIEVSKILKIEMFQASRLISRLEKMHFLVKQKSLTDSRALSIKISTKGLELIEKIEDFNYQTLKTRLHILNDTEIESLISGIQKLNDLLHTDE